MNAEATIRTTLWDYPNLWFESGRAGVLEHLFFVVGNGYDWVSGEIVAYYCDDSMSSDRDPYPGKDDEISNRLRVEYMAKSAHVRRNIDQYVKGPGVPRSLYPLSEHAMILTVPDDVTDDWLMVAVEAYNFYMPLYRSITYMVPLQYGDPIKAHLDNARSRLLALLKQRPQVEAKLIW